MEDEIFDFGAVEDEQLAEPEAGAEGAPPEEEPEAEPESVEPAGEDGQEPEQEPEPQEPPQPDLLQTRLQQLEQERMQQQAQIAQYNEYMRQLRSAAANFGFTGSDEEVLHQMCAQARGMSPQDYAAQVQAEQQAREAALQNDPRYQQMLDFERGQRARLRMANDLAQIKAKFPQETAATMEGIRNLDKYLDYFNKGVPAIEAYQLANMDMVTKRPPRPDGADKAHMIPAGGSAGTAMQEPPQDVMDLYRRLNPKASRDEIVKHWNKSQKGA